MARPMKPLVRGGGYYPSNRWTPLVYAGGYTTANGGEEPAPPPIEKTITGNPIHITDALAKPAQSLSVKLEPIQDLHGYDSPWPAGGGKNLLDPDYRSNLASNARFYYGTTGFFLEANTAYTFSVSSPSAQNSIIEIGGSQLTANYGRDSLTYTPTSDVYVWFDVYYAGNYPVPSGGTAAVNCQLELGSIATDYEPYSNICPITGHTSVNVIVSPTLNQSDGTTYTIPLGQTVYGGTLDVTTGVLTVTMAMVLVNTNNGTLRTNSRTSSTQRAFFVPTPTKENGISGFLSNQFAFVGGDTVGVMAGRAKSGGIEFCLPLDTPDTDVGVQQWFTDNPTELCYPLATPQTIQLTPTQVELLLGENNLFSDGEMTLVYLADGNASEIEALNILLGNRYYNNHESDEPTDREALDIVLGGKK